MVDSWEIITTSTSAKSLVQSLVQLGNNFVREAESYRWELKARNSAVQLCESIGVVEHWVSDWKIAGPCSIPELAMRRCVLTYLRLILIGAEQFIPCGSPARQKTWKQNPKKCSELMWLERHRGSGSYNEQKKSSLFSHGRLKNLNYFIGF